MPTLKQLTCHVEWPISKTPFREYGVSYGDGVVESHIAIPPGPTPFAISLKSKGFISSGLAMFVYIDGVYQCNRNRSNLKISETPGDIAQETATVEFRVRQKEERLPNGEWIGRPWRFEPLNIVHSPTADNPGLQSHFDDLGTIHVLVLRCFPASLGKGDSLSDTISDGSRSPESATSPMPGDEREGIVRPIFGGPRLQKVGDKGESMLQTKVLYDGPSDKPNSPSILNGRLTSYARVSNTDGPSPGHYEPKHKYRYRNRASLGGSWKQSKGNPDRRIPTRHPKIDEDLAQDYQNEFRRGRRASSLSANLMQGPSGDIWNSQNFQVPFGSGREPAADSRRLQSQGRYSSAAPSIVVNINTVPSFHSQPTSDTNNARHRDRVTENGNSNDGCYIISNGQRVQNGGGWHRQESPDREDGQRSNRNVVGMKEAENRKMGPKPMGNKNHKSKQTLDGWGTDNHQGASQVEESDGRGHNSFERGTCDSKAGSGWEPNNSRDNTGSEVEAEWTSGNPQEDRAKHTDWEEDHNQNDSPWKADDTWSTSDLQTNNRFENDSNWGQGDTQNDQAKTDDWFNNSAQFTDDLNKDNNGNRDGTEKQDSDQTNTWTAQSPKEISEETIGGNDTWNTKQSANTNEEIPWPSNSYEQTQENIPQSQPDWQTEPRETRMNFETEQKGQQVQCQQFQFKNFTPDPVQIFVSPMTERTASGEPSLYTVPSYIAESRSLSHQVQLGCSAEYIHRTRRPTYIDTLDEPYAKFVFKYRLKEAIERNFGITIQRDIDEEIRRLESVPKSEIITRLLRAERFLNEHNTCFPSHQDNNSKIVTKKAQKPVGERLLRIQQLYTILWRLQEPSHFNAAAHEGLQHKTQKGQQPAEREKHSPVIQTASANQDQNMNFQVDDWTSKTGQTSHHTRTGDQSSGNGHNHSIDTVRSTNQYSDWECSDSEKQVSSTESAEW
ncbi:hypothetical protein VTN00DRAFT_2462 [Thermoascus crustaceus]|uniref:uncharacterized protein n=1 Tax=Thermoascus crustaceus TaxID=5088 RepID=UPI003742CE2E